MEKYYPDNSLFSIEEHSGYSSALGNHFHSFLELYYLEQGQITYFIESSVKVTQVVKTDVFWDFSNGVRGFCEQPACLADSQEVYIPWYSNPHILIKYMRNSLSA